MPGDDAKNFDGSGYWLVETGVFYKRALQQSGARATCSSPGRTLPLDGNERIGLQLGHGKRGSNGLTAEIDALWFGRFRRMKRNA